MIAIACAFYKEAEYLVSALRLKASDRFSSQRCYEDDDHQIILMITGTGRLNAAASAAVLLSSVHCEHLVIFGSCAGLINQPAGSLYLIHKVTDINTGFSYYPDMEGITGYHEESLLTGDYPFGSHPLKRCIPLPYDLNSYISDPALNEYGLYDMEGSAYLFAAGKHLRSDQIHVFKVVSDNGEIPESDRFSLTMEKAADSVIPYIQSLTSDINKCTSDETYDLAPLFCCSFTMQQQLKQLIRYADAAGIDWQTIIDQYKRDGILPCKDRDSGKRVLYEFGKRIAG